MKSENNVLCVSNSYLKKYYFNPIFDSIPSLVKDELKSLCVLFTEDVGGVLMFKYNHNLKLEIMSYMLDNDIYYDEVGALLKIKKIKNEKSELIRYLEKYYKLVIKGENDVTSNWYWQHKYSFWSF